ncbi:MAG TPA: HAMP domain-containing sensor histidine kinase [Methylomirabilota bacterium]|nr:HAMP domain-containing sensor histidine kinase [Methylomirabilota bacterium]
MKASLDEHERARLLADVAGVVARAGDSSSVAQSVAELAVPGLADWCTLDILEHDTTVHRLALAHADPQCQARGAPLLGRWRADRGRGIAQVLQTGERLVEREVHDPSLLAPGADGEARRLVDELGAAGYVSVPIVVDSRALGALTLVAATDGRRFDDADVSLAETVARLVALQVERARLERENAQLRHHADDVLNALSHELRTPLTAVLAWLPLARHHAGDPVAREHALDTIDRNARALHHLVDDLLDMSHIIAGTLGLERRPVDLASVTHAATAEMAESARDRGVRVQTAIDAAAASCVGDRRRLQQVVSILLSNAIKFTRPGGHVSLQLTGDAIHVRLQISDTGRGIARDLLPHVFDLFRGGAPPPGLDLGLSLARALVQLHGGTLQADSAGENRGATFTVVLLRR